MKTSIIKNRFLKPLIALIFWVLVWYLIAALIDKEIFLPYPHTVLKRFFAISFQPDFLKTVIISFLRILLGFTVGTVFGFLLALLTNHSVFAETLISPAIRVVRTTPVVSFILLAYLWLSNDTIPIVIALLMVVPIVWQNVSAGLSNLDNNLLEMASVFKLSKAKTFGKIILPQLRPYLYSGCLTSLGLAWKSGIAAEVISYPNIAIGKKMNEAKVLLDTADVLVWTFTVIILCLAFEILFRLLFNRKRFNQRTVMGND